MTQYKTLVRPHLDYGIQAWRPWKQKDVDLLESVQRRATRMIPEIRHLDYPSRLKAVNLTTLETRRTRADLLEVFKIFKGIEDIDPTELFSTEHARSTRGHPYKITKLHSRLDVRKYSFARRIVSEWNRLPESAVMCEDINHFKGHLDKFLRHRVGDYTSQKTAPFPVYSSPICICICRNTSHDSHLTILSRRTPESEAPRRVDAMVQKSG